MYIIGKNSLPWTDEAFIKTYKSVIPEFLLQGAFNKHIVSSPDGTLTVKHVKED